MPKVKVKICGVRTKEAIEAAAQGGASYIGFNFYRLSPRYIFPDQAAQMSKIVPSSLKIVVVTADADDRIFDDVFERFTPDMLQFHGKETPRRVADLKTRFRMPVVKAIPITVPHDFEAAKPFEDVVDWLLFEGTPPTNAMLPGGNAAPFDWKLMEGKTFKRPWFLAGGLNAKNIAEALQVSGAQAVDVSSGVEKTLGEKDPRMIGEFLRTIPQT
ncbi:MAG: phosphoribosylanthranilate isomerase [Proteobacteria bacterium]|nr:phosphoribosylanthranilate isomerase [Pseudomonadota bacterium]